MDGKNVDGIFTFQYATTLIKSIEEIEVSVTFFTFQYATTLIIIDGDEVDFTSVFTFQYATTLMNIRQYIEKSVISLHSNMPLL